MKTRLVSTMWLVLTFWCVGAYAQTLNNQELEQSSPIGSVTVTPEDVKIIDGALALLSAAPMWHKDDDMACGDDERKGVMSLYCALQTSSVDVLGRYDHHRAALQEVRTVILQQLNETRATISLQDFNNMPDTTFSDVRAVLESAKVNLINHLQASTNPGRPEV